MLSLHLGAWGKGSSWSCVPWPHVLAPAQLVFSSQPLTTSMPNHSIPLDHTEGPEFSVAEIAISHTKSELSFQKALLEEKCLEDQPRKRKNHPFHFNA